MDLGKFGGDLYDGAGDLVDKGKEIVGTGIDKGTDVLGAGLEKVGADGWADGVEDWGDETASSLGAEVGEQRLGQSEQADELIHGRPEKIAAAVKNLRDFQTAFDLVGGGMKRLDSGQWKGVAADSFREKFQTLPTDWLRAADAFQDAATALERYAATVTSAQGKAGEAIALFKEGRQDYETAAAAFRKKAEAYNAVRNTEHPLPHPGKFTDPGLVKRQHAQEILERARRARNEAAEAAKGAITTAMAHAPKEPTGLDRAKQEFLDRGASGGIELAHFGAGALKGTAGLLNFARSVNPLDPYNLTHPADFYKGVNTTLAGLVTTVTNPDRALKNAWNALQNDPSEFLGRLIPELAGTKGGGGLLKGGLRSGMKDGLESGGRREARERTDRKPDESARCPADKTCKEDPIDMATGRMVLPQTDVALPGALPLVFRRSFESSYRAGRWFGAAWASTVDQRLEIDSQGVIFVREDGSLLAYPHPAPGVPVMPGHGQRWPLDRGAEGNYTVTDPETGRVWRFAAHQEDLALLVQIDDRNSRWITFEYDEFGAPTSLVHHGGYHLKLTTRGGRVTALHLAGAAQDGTDQQIMRYAYTDGHLTEVVNSSDLPLRFGCDEHGRIASWTDTNGSHFDYVYDDDDRCTAQSGTNGHLNSTFTYDTIDADIGLHVSVLTDSLGHTSRYLINDRAQVVAEIDAMGAATRFEYDRYNRLLSRTDALGHASHFAYDDAGRLIAAVRPDGRRSTAEYNELGLPVKVTGADGTVVRQTYDERGNRTSVTDGSRATTRFTYDEWGHLTSVTDALGHTSRIRNDWAGLPVEITNPLGDSAGCRRDAFGRPVAVTDAMGSTIQHQWTVEGLPARRVDPDGSEESWAHDGEGNCLSHTDAVGQVSRFEYTDFDLLVARTGPDGVRYEFGHDASLQLTRVTNPQGLTWNYTYDPAGRLIAETDFDGRTLRYGHDEAGRLITRTNGLGQTIHYEHNQLGQVLRKNADGAITTFEYDVFDELARAVGPDATLTRMRDRNGLLRSEAVNGRELTYGHDTLGRRISRTTPSGAASAWTYDAAGRRSTLISSGRTLAFTYDAAGQETARHIGETVSLTHEFDSAGRLTRQHVAAAGHSLKHRAYGYRADGNLVAVQDSRSGTRRFALDAAGRVTTVSGANWAETYAYDEAGNQTRVGWPTTHPGHEATGRRTYAGTRITRAGRVRYEHDAQGRVILRQKRRLSRAPETWRYTWDSEDRLTSVGTPDGTRWRYLYDPLGRRIAKQRLSDDGDSVVEHIAFAWDGTTLCEQFTSDEALPHHVALTWDHDGFRPLAQTERILSAGAPQDTVDERFFAVITDLIGTPTELIDESGTLAWHTRSTLWGSTAWAATSTTYTPLRFPGQYFDPETGLHYNYFRHYDPEMARYVTADPLGLHPDPNDSTYVDNPLLWCDPVGLSPCPPNAVSETREGKGSIVSKYPMTADEALRAGEEFLGEGYGEMGKNRGVFRSADGLRQFRIDQSSLDGGHWPWVPHVHFQIFEHAGDKRSYVNNHVPLIE